MDISKELAAHLSTLGSKGVKAARKKYGKGYRAEMKRRSELAKAKRLSTTPSLTYQAARSTMSKEVVDKHIINFGVDV